MALKDTVKQLHAIITAIAKDLIKAEKGNKTAAQRVRTGTIKFEKVAKKYRKESMKSVKKKTARKKKKKTTRRKRR